MKKYIYYIVAAVLVAGAVFSIIMLKDDGSTFQESDKNFAITDTGEVHKIFMADKSGPKVTLEKRNGTWWVNNEFPAKEMEMQMLLTTMRLIKPAAPVPSTGRNTVIKDMATHHVKVELYDQKGKLIKSYYVGSPTLSGRGNYMKMADSEEIFAVEIPGFQGHLSSRYVAEEEIWRSTRVFAHDPVKIHSISVQYANEPGSSFDIQKVARDSFQVLNGAGEVIQGDVDESKVYQYFDHFKNIHVEAYANDFSGRQEITQQPPRIIMAVTEEDGTTNEVKIYPKPISQRSRLQYDQEGNPIEFDLDRYYALVNDGNDFSIIQDFVFGKLFTSPGWFMKE